MINTQLDIDIIVQGANRNERGSGKYYEYLNHLFKVIRLFRYLKIIINI